MLRLSQIVKLLAILTLAGGVTAAWSAQGPAASSPPAKSRATAGKSAKGKSKAKKMSRAPQSAPQNVAKDGQAAGKAANLPMQHRRDPFASLVSKEQTGPSIPANLPPGKAGLMVSTLRVDGVVRGASGMLVLVSNPQQRVYFLRQGDRLYDGLVEQISMDGVTFRETGKDPFGKPIERIVRKRIYPTAGEQ